MEHHVADGIGYGKSAITKEDGMTGSATEGEFTLSSVKWTRFGFYSV